MVALPVSAMDCVATALPSLRAIELWLKFFERIHCCDAADFTDDKARRLGVTSTLANAGLRQG